MSHFILFVDTDWLNLLYLEVKNKVDYFSSDLAVKKLATLVYSFDKIEPMTKFTKRESAIFQFGFLAGLGVATICFVVYIFSSSWY